MTKHVNKAKLAFLFQREYEPRFPISRGMHSCESFYVPLVRWTPNGESVRNLVSDFGTDHVGIADDGLSIVETWDPGYNDLSLYVWVTRHHVHPEQYEVVVRLEWHEPFSVKFDRAQKLAMTARKIDARLKRIEQRNGVATDWREALRRYMTVLGVQKCAAVSNSGGPFYSDCVFTPLSVEATIRHVEKLAAAAHALLDEKVAA